MSFSKYIQYQIWKDNYIDMLSKMPIENVIQKLPRVEIVDEKTLKTSYHRKSKEFYFVSEFLISKGYEIIEIKLTDNRFHINK